MSTLTKMQIAAMSEIAKSISGKLIFGNGFGRYRVALRPLLMRHPPLIEYERRPDGEEQFSLTEAGRKALGGASHEQ